MPTPLPVCFDGLELNCLDMPDWVTGSSGIRAIGALSDRTISAATNCTGGGVTPLYENTQEI